LQCIGDLFQGANDIMSWLTSSARIISKSIPNDRILEAMELDKTLRAKKDKATTTRMRKEQMTTVVWTTPLGLPVVQPYRKVKRKQIHANLQSVYISDPNAPAEGEQTPITCFDIVLMRFQLIYVQSTRRSRRRLSRLTLSIAWMRRICCLRLWNVGYDFLFAADRDEACLPSVVTDTRPGLCLGS
jgi:hypothetical protein